MEKVEWNEQYNIGVDIIDTAHANLFRIVGRLMEHMKDTRSSWHACEEGIKYLEGYTMKHFSEEEAFMRSIQYKGYGKHKKIHDNFRDKTLISLRQELRMSNYSSASMERFLGVVLGWLTGHIMMEDQAIVGKVGARKPCEFSPRISAIAKIVDHTLQDVFQVEAKLDNANYKGQNIGKGFYSRMVYDIDNHGKVRLLLGIEEPLVFHSIGQILEAPLLKKDYIIDTAAQQIFEMLFLHMSRVFRSETIYEPGSNDLLSRDEFRSDFMKGYPCSLLFGTRHGYFIFCFRTWKTKGHHRDPQNLLR